jgi:hypothetical protein
MMAVVSVSDAKKPSRALVKDGGSMIMNGCPYVGPALRHACFGVMSLFVTDCCLANAGRREDAL